MNVDDFLNTPIDEIQHHGIKGMKWGVRRPVGKNGLVARGLARTAAKIQSTQGKVNSKIAAKAREDAKSFKDQRDILTKNKFFTNEQVDAYIKTYESKASKFESKASINNHVAKGLMRELDKVPTNKKARVQRKKAIEDAKVELANAKKELNRIANDPNTPRKNQETGQLSDVTNNAHLNISKAQQNLKSAKKKKR